MADLTNSEQQALIWPIKAKGAVDRLQPLNDPAISQYYQNSMEQGRFLESSIADANLWLFQKKVLLNEYIISYTHMNSLAVDGQLGHHPRRPKFIADSISILQTANRLRQELVSLVNAINGNINKILAIEQSMLGMVNTASNSLANLLNNICNWGIPALPSIPNLFPDQLWNWNGFLFSPVALFSTLKSSTTFNFNFNFSDCSFGPTAPSALFTTDPLSTETYSGLVYGSANYFVPPFGGSVVNPNQDFNDAAFIASMQANTSSPVFETAFNPHTNMWGAMPDPHYIISKWQVAADEWDSFIVSIVPSLRHNTVFVGDPDYDSPNTAVRDLQLRKDLINFVNLGNIVASNFDPLLTAAWIDYLELARAGRGGVWIPNFEAAYEQYIKPSVSILSTVAVPWNNVLGQTNFFWMSAWDATIDYVVGDVVTYNGSKYIALMPSIDVLPGTDDTIWGAVPANTIYSNAPVIPLLTTFASLSPAQLSHVLWQLSYVEASLLGYTRNAQWDAYQDTSYVSGPTGTDLDYQSTPISTQNTSLVLGTGTAEFPVPITFPTSFKTSMDAVILLASADIQADASYLSPRLANRFTYNQFAQATQVDRFSQFWRDFATNLTAFLAQDPYLVQQTATYPLILNGAINPLGDATAYNSLLQDVSSRSRTWTPGTPLLPIPIQPVTIPPSSFQPDLSNNGWINNMDFNPVAFLARPDIQALPIPVQIAMLRTNLSYAGINVWKNNMQASIDQHQATATSLLQATQEIGFHVTIYTTTTDVPPGTIGAFVAFDPPQLPNDFDYTGNVTNATTFTIQSTGTYNGLASINWTVDDIGAVTITVLQNNVAVATATANSTAPGDLTTAITFIGNFNQGDVVQVQATTNFPGNEQVVPGAPDNSIFTMVKTGPTTPPTPIDNTGNTDDTRTFNMDSNAGAPGTEYYWVTTPVPALTAVRLDASGDVIPIDPLVPAVTNIAIATNVLTVTCDNHFAPAGGQLVVFSGLSNASFLNGQVVTVTAATPTSFTASFTHADYSTADTGSVLYAIDSSGAVLAPIPDGVTVASSTAGSSVDVGTYYGGLYTYSAATWIPGALIYAGPQGYLTQDYATLITEVGWVICVGRAINSTDFIWEPHIPNRFSSLI